MNFVLRKYATKWTIGSDEHGKPPACTILLEKAGPRVVIWQTSVMQKLNYSIKEMIEAETIAAQQAELIAITKRLMS